MYLGRCIGTSGPILSTSILDPKPFVETWSAPASRHYASPLPTASQYPTIARLLLSITLKSVFLTGAQGHRVGNSRHLQLSVTAADFRSSEAPASGLRCPGLPGTSLRCEVAQRCHHPPMKGVGPSFDNTTSRRSCAECKHTIAIFITSLLCSCC